MRGSGLAERAVSPGAWLAELFSDAEGRLGLSVGRFRADWYDLDDGDSIDRAVCGRPNAYFHVALHDPTLDPEAKRGRNSTATALAFLWDDGDLHGPAHPRGGLPESSRELVEFFETLLPGPPSCLVYSGHGVYPFWRLSEPLDLRNDEERLVARRLLAAYRRRRDSEAEARGWRLDEVGGFAKVLRVPGSINAKPSLPRAPVTIARLPFRSMAARPCRKQELLRPRGGLCRAGARNRATGRPERCGSG